MGLFKILIEQSRLPTGRLGRIMLRIMNNAHRGLTLWGLSKLQPCQNVLDVGCGGGNAVRLMAETGKFGCIYGIDLSPDAVSLTIAKNHKYVESGLVTVMQASVLKLPFENDFFNAATAFQSHYHWPDILPAVHEIYRVLKPGGQFVLAAEIYKIEYHMKEYNDIERTGALFEDCGFKDIDLLTNRKHICITGYK
ncbi:MAG: class I SAM-dependent methyltransferase [Candidatus Methanoplasma sp.]|jgi:ubiquinone/menaquinone biosynthesis C-methylase UbiE|nr:class I SAM-dependent methyltransferase [Candidatus Methanoplasma sp.]